MPEFRSAAVLLAAGASTRLGQSKQLIRLEGESLLHRTARLAVEAGCSPVFVVLGFEAQRMQVELRGLPVEVLTNPQWEEGMGSSLRFGMTALCRHQPQPDSVLVLLCDQPRLTAEHLRELLAAHKEGGGSAITASVYAQRAGVPAIFPARLFPELLASVGDQGAKNLIRAHAVDVQGILWPEGEFDLDRPQDLNRLDGIS
jgi:molybdenum cofactor cytidylyltransferase